MDDICICYFAGTEVIKSFHVSHLVEHPANSSASSFRNIVHSTSHLFMGFIDAFKPEIGLPAPLLEYFKKLYTLLQDILYSLRGTLGLDYICEDAIRNSYTHCLL